MIPVDFEEKTGVYGAPPGMEDSIGGLPFLREHIGGVPHIVSYWRPTEAECALLARGGQVKVVVMGEPIRPMMVGVGKVGTREDA